MDWNHFINDYQHHIAGIIYLAAAVGFCLFWWRLTGGLKYRGWRDLFRGIAIVLIFTPWFVSDAHVFYAPALMVVVMDVLIGSSPNGLAASMALLIAAVVMLVALMIRMFFRGRKSSEET